MNVDHAETLADEIWSDIQSKFSDDEKESELEWAVLDHLYELLTTRQADLDDKRLRCRAFLEKRKQRIKSRKDKDAKSAG